MFKAQIGCWKEGKTDNYAQKLFFSFFLANLSLTFKDKIT